MQIPALTIARDWGWRVICADGSPKAPGLPLAHEFIPLDLKEEDALIEAAGVLQQERGLDGVFTAGTDFTVVTARIAQALGLPGISVETARRATDKVLMRQTFREAGIPSPAFVEIGPQGNPALLTASIPGPWVVKPVDAMGSRGVQRIDDKEQLLAALEEARSCSRSGRALVESYMEGPEFSLDALVEDGKVTLCGLADRHIQFDPYFVEIGHTIPSGFPSSVQRSLLALFERGIQALGIQNGAAKGDLKLTAAGPMVGEIAARLSGGYMSGWTYPSSTGVEATRGALRLALGLPPELPPPSFAKICAERALVGIDGTILSLEGEAQARGLPGVQEVFLSRRPGEEIRFPQNNVEKVGSVITAAPLREEAQVLAREALKKIHLVLDPRDKRTGLYLEKEGPFPPDTYPLQNDVFSQSLGDLWNRYPPRPGQGAPPDFRSLAPLPGMEDYPLRDLCGRSLEDSLLVLVEEGLLVLDKATPLSPGASSFWKALIRGGIIGGRWYLQHVPE